MARLVYRDATQVNLIIFNPSLPSGITWDDEDLSIDWRASSSTSWNSISLASAVVGTWTSGGWVELDSQEYQLGLPNAAIVPGDRTTLRVKYGTEVFLYDAVDAVLQYVPLPSNFSLLQISSSGLVTTTPPNISFNINVPPPGITITTLDTIYVHELERTVEFIANTDIESIPLQLVFEETDRTDILVVEDIDLTKEGTKVLYELPNTLTDGERTVVWGIRHAVNQRVYGFGQFTISYAPHEDPEE